MNEEELADKHGAIIQEWSRDLDKAKEVLARMLKIERDEAQAELIKKIEEKKTMILSQFNGCLEGIADCDCDICQKDAEIYRVIQSFWQQIKKEHGVDGK